jgi:hypothetical protein
MEQSAAVAQLVDQRFVAGKRVVGGQVHIDLLGD